MTTSPPPFIDDNSQEEFKKKKADIVSKCKGIVKDHPNNKSCKYAISYLDESDEINIENIDRFIKCIKTGIDNPDSNLGCYAMKPTDYSDFGGFFEKVIRDYHGNTGSADCGDKKQHVTSWETNGEEYDVKQLGVTEDISMRVRVGRNLVGTNLPGMMTQEDRIEFEKKMLPAFEKLVAEYGGKVMSLSPNFGNDIPNPNLISEEEYQTLVNDHIMFKDMSADLYLQSAGISNDWPYGRGCWHSEDKTKIIWFGEEDQLRIMCMKSGTNLLSVFKTLESMLTVLENIDGIDFAKNDNYGYVTSCPSNLGTGMRASAHVKVPMLTFGGSDEKVKAICNKVGLSVRGVGGEHTPIGEDGTVDISPSSRLFVTEADVIALLYSGIETLNDIENTVTGFVGNSSTTDSKVTAKCEGNIVAENRDEKETVNFVLIDDSQRDQVESDQQNVNVMSLKEQFKKESSSMRLSPNKLLLDMKEIKSMSVKTPNELKMSPSPVLAIQNE